MIDIPGGLWYLEGSAGFQACVAAIRLLAYGKGGRWRWLGLRSCIECPFPLEFS